MRSKDTILHRVLTPAQIVAEANAAIDEALKMLVGAEMYRHEIADRQSTLCYLLRSVYIAGMTAEAARQHENRINQ